MVLLLVLLVVICLLLIYCKIRRRKRRRPHCSTSPIIPVSSTKCNFTLDQVKEFTDGFSNCLGEGGYGHVYHGVLPTGIDVAVKRPKVGSGQGECEFLTEVEIMSQVHHKHVVSLVGYCTAGCILVYELVTNNTLEFHLHGEGGQNLDWPTRLKIALGFAEGIAYLHEDRALKIIHRDIKAANILLDSEYEPKIADFGLARCISKSKSHVSTEVKGTCGYLAPEYFLTGKLTEKSDIYSFGVVLLELITGRKPWDAVENSMGLVDWARPQLTRALEDGEFNLLVDPKLQNHYDNNEMARMVACAAACVRQSAGRRPKMSKIVLALKGGLPLSDLNDGIRPGLSILYRFLRSSDDGTSQDHGNSCRMPLASQVHGSSPYREHTSGSSSECRCCRTTRDLEMGRMERDNEGFIRGS